MGWAGPFAARHLADLGADIIKIESRGYFDWYRGTDESEEFRRSKQYEKNLTFNLMNRNKRGITLDLTTTEGKATLKALAATAHGVIENYSAEVLPKLGLDYPVLSAARPELVMVSMAAFGAGNRWSKTRAYGGTLEQASGLPVVSGHDHWPPTMTTYAHGDPGGRIQRGRRAAARSDPATAHRVRRLDKSVADRGDAVAGWRRPSLSTEER